MKKNIINKIEDIDRKDLAFRKAFDEYKNSGYKGSIVKRKIQVVFSISKLCVDYVFIQEDSVIPFFSPMLVGHVSDFDLRRVRGASLSYIDSEPAIECNLLIGKKSVVEKIESVVEMDIFTE